MSELRIVRGSELPSFPLAEGIDIFPITGKALNINVVVLKPNAVAAVHTHDEEQVGYIVSGSCTFTDGSAEWSLEPGDTYHAAPNVPHGATASADGCVIIDAFSPPRAAVLKLLGLA